MAKESNQYNKYLEEYNKYKHIVISPGIYKDKNKLSLEYEISNIDLEKETATVTTAHSGVSKSRTLHWIRKNLSPN